MKAEKQKVSQVMRDLWKTKEKLSRRYLALTPEERERAEQEAMDQFVKRTGIRFVIEEPPPKREHRLN